MPIISYQAQWIATARLLGYSINQNVEQELKWVDDPDGKGMHDTLRSIHVPLDLDHWAVVRDMEERFGLKWNNQPYSTS